MIKQIGETIINPIYKSNCHCGAVELEIKLPEGIADPYLIENAKTYDGANNHPSDRNAS